MVGQVGTGTPLVLVCLALLRSSAGRRALIKKRGKEATWYGLLRCQAATKTRVRASRFFSRRGVAAPCEREEACFRPWLGRGAAKEKKAAGARGCSLCRRRGAAGEEEENDEKQLLYRHNNTHPAARQPRPAAAAIPQPPPSLVTALHLAALPPRRRRALLSSRSAGRRSRSLPRSRSR